MEPVRLGVIGCGVIGTVHMNCLAGHDSVDIVAAADLRQDVVDAAAAKHGATAYYTAEALLADPTVEGVILAMPTNLRTELGLKAFAAGKHVLTEKPVALNGAEVRQLLAAQGDRVAACCSSRYRSLASAQAATDFLATGALGDIRSVRCRAMTQVGGPPNPNPPPWRLSRKLNGGGILVNWGCYDLDYLLGLLQFRLRPQQVYAAGWPVAPELSAYAAPGSDAEAHVSFLARCEGGAVINYERAEFSGARKDSAWEIVGSRGSLALWMPNLADKRLVFTQVTAGEAATESVVWEGEDDGDLVHSGPALDFASAIRHGHPPRTSLADALIVQALTDAVYASMDSGQAAAVTL